jgi:microcystin-dependent protein
MALASVSFIILLFFNLSVMAICEGDLNCDGNTDGADLSIFAEDFGVTGCSTACQVRMKGEIIMWGGEMDVTGKYPIVNDTVDERWHICDGTDDTPDLRDRFVIGAGNNYATFEVGGNAELTLSLEQMPSHRHSPGTLAAAEADATHRHNHLDHILKKSDTVQVAAAGLGYYHINRFNPDESENRGGIHYNAEAAATHSHDSLAGLTDYAGGSQPASILPPYYALVFLMYVGN